MQFTAAAIAQAIDGRLVGPDTTVDGATIDSRTLAAGQLFVPIVAERDGHDFVPAALSAGAGAYLTAQPAAGGTAIEVDDTAAALSRLGRAARHRLTVPIVGITGSVGKTSVKDLTAGALGSAMTTHASEKSFNNEMGVPLTLINAPTEAGAVVVEMGARGLGHIADLCQIARPTIGVVTMVGAVHTSEFGSIEAVAQAKGELVEALPADGTAILNADVDAVAAMADRTDGRVITYGSAGDVRAHDVVLDDELRPSFTIGFDGRSAAVSLATRGAHQVSNALAAAAVGIALGVDLDVLAAGLAATQLSPWRMEFGRTPSGAVVINDAYNANAISVAAALESLARLPARRRVAVLGVMAELGALHDAEHERMGRLAAELGIDVIALAEPAYGVATVGDIDEALASLGPLGADDAVLVKGSRVAGLERLAARLLA